MEENNSPMLVGQVYPSRQNNDLSSIGRIYHNGQKIIIVLLSLPIAIVIIFCRPTSAEPITMGFCSVAKSIIMGIMD